MDKATEIILNALLWGALIYIPIIVIIVLVKRREKRFINSHRKIHLGMSKFEVVEILGHKYTQSYLANNVEKLEWRYKHSGYTGRLSKGVYAHSSSYTRRISVKFKDDKVIELNCLNMD